MSRLHPRLMQALEDSKRHAALNKALKNGVPPIIITPPFIDRGLSERGALGQAAMLYGALARFLAIGEWGRVLVMHMPKAQTKGFDGSSLDLALRLEQEATIAEQYGLTAINLPEVHTLAIHFNQHMPLTGKSTYRLVLDDKGRGYTGMMVQELANTALALIEYAISKKHGNGGEA